MFNSYVTNYQRVETYQSTRRPSTRSRWARHLWTQALETFGNGTRKCCQLPNPPSISHIFTSFPGPASSFPHAELASRRNQGQSPPPKCPWWPLLEPRSSVTSHLENTMTLYTYIILYIYIYIIIYIHIYIYIISYYIASYIKSYIEKSCIYTFTGLYHICTYTLYIYYYIFRLVLLYQIYTMYIYIYILVLSHQYIGIYPKPDCGNEWCIMIYRYL